MQRKDWVLQLCGEDVTEGQLHPQQLTHSTTCRRLRANPWSHHEEGTAPLARASQN